MLNILLALDTCALTCEYDFIYVYILYMRLWTLLAFQDLSVCFKSVCLSPGVLLCCCLDGNCISHCLACSLYLGPQPFFVFSALWVLDVTTSFFTEFCFYQELYSLLKPSWFPPTRSAVYTLGHCQVAWHYWWLIWWSPGWSLVCPVQYKKVVLPHSLKLVVGKLWNVLYYSLDSINLVESFSALLLSCISFESSSLLRISGCQAYYVEFYWAVML